MEDLNQIYARLKSRKEGLTASEAAARLLEFGPNVLKPKQRCRWLVLLFSQFTSPLVLLLIGAGVLSFFLGAHLDMSIIGTIVLLSGILGFFQEFGALNALEKLLSLVANKATVLRENKEIKIPIDLVVPGDMVILRSGDLIPGDCILIDSNNLFVDESTLSGESGPVEKPEGSKIYLGTMASSGIGWAMVETTGQKTKYGQISESARFHPPETAFEIGVKKFGGFLLEMTMGITVTLFILNLFLKKGVMDSLLFSLAIAVGLTPQLLPAIISINLSHGVRRMAKKKVIVKRLASIENFGQMNIFCSDKTGTITEGKMSLIESLGADGSENEKAAFYGYLNAKHQAGYTNPLDAAVLGKLHYDDSSWNLSGEIPYDFNRKRISLFFEHENQNLQIVKGALYPILDICSRTEWGDGSIGPMDEGARNQIDKVFKEKTGEGKKVIAIAYGESKTEENLIFLGFYVFYDPTKPKIKEVLSEMKRKGVALKILTGDRRESALFTASEIGIEEAKVIIGEDIDQADDELLKTIVRDRMVFAEINPKQKERIILSLRSTGNVVGYLGDGVNDVAALHAADVGISVDSGAPAAKEAADIVLLKKDLHVLKDGIEEGRKTFVNTLKYVYMASSANFGNMISMAGASLFINFLPILPKQILLTNFFSDLPEMALATDHVDNEIAEGPVKWDLPLIQRFMAVFGALNSIADLLTFSVLLFWFEADETFFRTAWTIENIITAALIVLAIRTQRIFWRSKPSFILFIASVGVAVLAPFLPYTGLGRLFSFEPIPLAFYAILLGILIWFFLSVEIAKYFFFRRKKNPKTA